MSAGVYVLAKHGKPIYVGQSRHVQKRIESHRAKRFDGFWYQEVATSSLRAIEAWAIKQLRPPLNVAHNPDRCTPTVSFTFLLPAEHLRALRAVAAATGRSVGAVARQALHEYIQERMLA